LNFGSELFSFFLPLLEMLQARTSKETSKCIQCWYGLWPRFL
jgi:hypothetical protein